VVRGADAAIVGSACVACVANARAHGRDVVEDFHALLVELGAVPQLTGGGTARVTTHDLTSHNPIRR